MKNSIYYHWGIILEYIQRLILQDKRFTINSIRPGRLEEISVIRNLGLLHNSSYCKPTKLIRRSSQMVTEVSIITGVLMKTINVVKQ